MGTLIVRPKSRFVLTIKTNNLSTGSTVDNQFRIPHYTTGTYDYRVDWGDGTVENVTGNTSPTHTYASIGTYNVKIWGIFEGIYFNNTEDSLKLLNIVSVDRRNKQLAFNNSYYNCANLSSFPLLDTSSGANFSAAWRNCSSLTSFPLIDTSSGTSFLLAWELCSSLTSFPLIDTSSGANFSAAWRNCSSLTSFPLLNTSSGTTFLNAWELCSSLTSFPLIDTSSSTNFSAAWRDCSSLTSFPANFFDNWVGVPVINCFLSTWLRCNALTAQSVENILVSIDTSGRNAPAGATGTQADITITYNVATGVLSSATNTAITNLKVKGWKPYINNVYV